MRVEERVILLDGFARVQLDGARLSDTALPTPTRMPSVRVCLSEALPRATGGLFPLVAALLTGEVPPRDPLARLAAPDLARLYAAISARDAADCLAASRPLLGLGPGLTPAGDDCVAGWLAGAWTAAREGRSLVEAIAQELLAAAGERTGRLSRDLLAAAAAGQASEPARDFARAPNQARLARLLSVGATSGADFLGGYLLARAALASLSLRPSPPAGERRVSHAQSDSD